GGEQLRTGAVEAAGRRVPGLLQDAESLRAALPPGGHRTGQLGGAAAGGRGEGGVEGAGGRGEAGTGAGGGEPHRVLPEAEAADRVAAGGQQGVGACRGVTGELVQREGIGAAGRRRGHRGRFGVRGRRQRGGQWRPVTAGEHVAGAYAGQRLRFLLLGGAGRAGGAAPGQVVDDRSFAPAPEEQQDEGVGVEQIGRASCRERV